MRVSSWSSPSADRLALAGSVARRVLIVGAFLGGLLAGLWVAGLSAEQATGGAGAAQCDLQCEHGGGQRTEHGGMTSLRKAALTNRA
jgi:hypothetical protein